MTLPSSGPLTLYDINGEFGRGYNLNAYRGTQWWTDAGASGTFSTGQIGIADFYGKRGTSPAGVASATYTWGGQIENTGTAIHLGADASNRFIVVFAAGYALQSPELTQCYLNGVSLPLLHKHRTTVLDTDANTRYQKTSIFGGYYTGAVDVTAIVKNDTGANTGCNAYVGRLTGYGLALRSTNQTVQGQDRPITIPNKGIMLGAYCQNKHQAPNWVNLDQIGIINNGVDTVKGGFTSAAAWRYVEAAGTYNVRCAGCGTFVGIG